MNETPVTFLSERQQVVGMWHRPKGRGPFPVVLFVHGYTGSRVEAHRLFVQQARALASEGIASLRFDCRGSGDSAGEFHEMTVAGECADARAALRWIRKQPSVDRARVGLLGFSMGGMVAAFTLEKERALKTTVLWNPVAHPRERRDARMSPEAVADLRRYGTADNGGWIVGEAFLKELGRLAPLKAVRAVKQPVLLVAGTNDETVPMHHAADYHRVFTRAGSPCSLHAIKGADHTFASRAWTAEALAVTAQWFVQHL
ncbi:MAG TPA: alpha/beta fold hydrolase [Kiritimatiellia bacterium]|nr:alpha/beta fold hydrolase [Kiritimatiellia bacterium]